MFYVEPKDLDIRYIPQKGDTGFPLLVYKSNRVEKLSKYEETIVCEQEAVSEAVLSETISAVCQ